MTAELFDQINDFVESNSVDKFEYLTDNIEIKILQIIENQNVVMQKWPANVQIWIDQNMSGTILGFQLCSCINLIRLGSLLDSSNFSNIQ